MGSPSEQPLAVQIEPMRLRDVAAVLEVEKQSFTSPWSGAAFVSELLSNERAHYLVAKVRDARRALVRAGTRLIGYIGVWLVVDEGHITNVAVHPDYRGHGIGRRLLTEAIDFCAGKGATRMTLEVRVSNEIAQRLYRDLGFVAAGVRPGYYRDNNEDALIMWKEM